MKTKEELLKIYSAYLPYQLQCLIQGHNNQDGKAIKETMLGIYDGTEIFTSLGSKDYQTNEIEDVFPILYSMDMLTKEIEHKGERFVPLVKLAEIEAGEHSCDEVDESIEDEGYAFYIEYLPSWFGLYFNKHKCTFTRWDDGEGKDSCSNELRDKLLEWHFNVFGLKESEYIKKESAIKQKGL